MGGKSTCQGPWAPGGQARGISRGFEAPCWVFTISQATRGNEWDVPGTWRRVAISKVGVCSGNGEFELRHYVSDHALLLPVV